MGGFYDILLKSWLDDNGFEMYSTHNDRKPAGADSFIRTLRSKI